LQLLDAKYARPEKKRSSDRPPQRPHRGIERRAATSLADSAVSRSGSVQPSACTPGSAPPSSANTRWVWPTRQETLRAAIRRPVWFSSNSCN